MQLKNKKLKSLVEKYQEISYLGQISQILDWDMNVNLPPKAAEGRSRQAALLAQITTKYWLAPEFKNLYQEVETEKAQLEDFDRKVFRKLAHAAHYYFSVPPEIVIEKVKTASKAFMVWQKARRENNFANFAPYLEKIVHLNQLEAKHLGFTDNPYDALLDLFEPGLTAKTCVEIFGILQPALTKMLQKIKPSEKDKKADEILGEGMNYPISDQRQLAIFVLKKMGYDWDAGRLDISPHPFTTSLDHYDVRITTRYSVNDFLESLTGAIHEGGHALYDQGVNPDFINTPLDGGVSLGIHESQSRFWENQVGRSLEFVNFLTPILQAFYPEQLGHIGVETISACFNRVKPGLIRVEADEVSYNLHIILRFEIENALINNKIKVKDVPEIWREKMKKYLGVAMPNDKDGALQDIHWSLGSFGYFPTYTLGNLYAAQIAAKMKKELDLPALLERGQLGTILSWLRENIHQYGGLYYPDELAQKITGETLNPKYFISYIKEKYNKLYNLNSA